MAIEEYGKQNVCGLSISYGQKHAKELEAAKKIADYYEIEFISLDLSRIFAYSDCSLLTQSQQEIPRESYAKQLENSEGKPVSTYVPFRNGLFLSSAASIALSKGCSVIYYGAHSDDAGWKCLSGLQQFFSGGNEPRRLHWKRKSAYHKSTIWLWTKAEVVERGLMLHVPYELTWSCYEGGAEPCGKCGTCIDRAEAFAKNGMKDPALTRGE